VDAFTNESLPDNIREKVGAALVCKRYDRRGDNDLPWQSFHLSRVLADSAFEKVGKQLDEYSIIDTDWPVQLETPTGDEFSCYQYNFD